MLAGIEVIEAMSQYAHGFVAAGERLSVRHDVYAIGQAAYDEHPRGELLQVGDEAANEVFAVRGAVAGSDDVDYPLLVDSRTKTSSTGAFPSSFPVPSPRRQ